MQIQFQMNSRHIHDSFLTMKYRHGQPIPNSHSTMTVRIRVWYPVVISISRNGLLKSCARFVIERSEIRKKQHDFKSVHFECRMVLQSTFFPQNVEKAIFFIFYIFFTILFNNYTYKISTCLFQCLHQLPEAVGLRNTNCKRNRMNHFS